MKQQKLSEKYKQETRQQEDGVEEQGGVKRRYEPTEEDKRRYQMWYEDKIVFS